MKPLTASIAAPYFAYEKAVADLKLRVPNTREEYDQQEAALGPLRAERDAKISAAQSALTPLQRAAQETLYPITLLVYSIFIILSTVDLHVLIKVCDCYIRSCHSLQKSCGNDYLAVRARMRSLS